MTFTRSEDYALIRRILLEPRSFRRMSPRVRLEAVELNVQKSDRIEYVLAEYASEVVAVFLVVDGYQIHFCFTPDARGKCTEPVAEGFLRWAWANLPVDRLVGAVPNHNRLALRLARSVGFTEFAANSNDGLTLLEIRKPHHAAPLESAVALPLAA